MFEVVELGGVKTTTSKSACNHVYVVDVSGSMYGDLPKIRQHLKNIISVVAQPEDTFSIIYFSGRGQCGSVFENVEVSDVGTITMMHAAIDRFIQPIGLTGFVDPIEKALSLNLSAGKLNNFIMLTDGYDNQNRRETIMAGVDKLPSVFQSISFIEYGYYADRQIIAEMAARVNGVHIFAEGITKYETAFEDVVRGVARVNQIVVDVNKKAKHCVYVYNGQIRIAAVENGQVSVPEDVGRIYSVVPGDVLNKQLSEDHLYLVLYYAAKTENSDLVWKTLAAIGDVALVRAYENAFTKQELSCFEDLCFDAVVKPETRYTEGKDLDAVPDKNAKTIVDLLNTLAVANAQLVVDSKSWNYKARSRARIAGDDLPKFEQSPLSRVAMRGLVFNSERPNVSIQTTVNGVVRLPANDYGLETVKSFITRNYTIISDGIRNVDCLPVVFDSRYAAELEVFSHDVIEEEQGLCYWIFDLGSIPVVNRAGVEDVGLGTFITRVAAAEELKANIKVIKYYIDQQGGTNAKIAGMIDAYGEEAAKWLSSIGVRDYGFSPVGTKSAEASDEYESVQVVTKIKGLSSLPSIAAVQKKVGEKKKLTVADTLIKQALDDYAGFDASQLEAELTAKTRVKRSTEALIAKDVYALVLGRKWFGDDEEVSVDVTMAGLPTTISVQKVRKMIAI